MTEMFAPSAQGITELVRLGSGRQAVIFGWPAGGVLKLFNSPADLPSARQEADIMRRLSPAEIPMARFLGSVTVDERPGILMEQFAGPDHLTLVERKPWMVWYVATSLAKLHTRVHMSSAPQGLRSLRQSVREEIEASEHVPAEMKALAFADLDRLPDGDTICHWDFHPANVVDGPDSPGIIDWANARSGDRLADVARTLMILRDGALPPGASTFMKLLTAFGRRLLAWRYLNAYRRSLPVRQGDLDAWRRVSLISRLSYGVHEEREMMLELIRQA